MLTSDMRPWMLCALYAVPCLVLLFLLFKGRGTTEKVFIFSEFAAGQGSPQLLPILMSRIDVELFLHYVNQSTTYVEYGSGGSSTLAAVLAEKVYVIEHNQEWCKKVSAKLADTNPGVADVRCISPAPISGPLSAPTYETDYPKFDAYVREIDNLPLPDGKADVILIDGRFRNACATYSMRHMRPDSVLLVHDFWARPSYHKLLKYFDVVDGPKKNQNFFKSRRPDSLFEKWQKSGLPSADAKKGVISFRNKWGQSFMLVHQNDFDQSVMAVLMLKEGIRAVPDDEYKVFLDEYM